MLVCLIDYVFRFLQELQNVFDKDVGFFCNNNSVSKNVTIDFLKHSFHVMACHNSTNLIFDITRHTCICNTKKYVHPRLFEMIIFLYRSQTDS